MSKTMTTPFLYTLILQTVDFHRHRMKQIKHMLLKLDFTDLTDVMKHHFRQEIVNKLQNVNYNDLFFINNKSSALGRPILPRRRGIPTLHLYSEPRISCGELAILGIYPLPG